ncbi:hypothetical protein [Nocardioides yefusunii]|uniref:YbaB/EbfC DNA-binding family protein n=1 Tax=Nocardioides yefusunii TaxID=2500546 RepID=A0ABW1QX94_9ACTN|nr:hypothetical protein [Nocardioides yefusunii]
METTRDAAADMTRTLDEQMARAEAAVVRARAHADRITRLRGRGSYRGVHVIVDAGGMLTDIRFDDATRGTAPATLAHAVQFALRAALTDVMAAARAVTVETWGEDDPVVLSSLDDMAARFGIERANGQGAS